MQSTLSTLPDVQRTGSAAIQKYQRNTEKYYFALTIYPKSTTKKEKKKNERQKLMCHDDEATARNKNPNHFTIMSAVRCMHEE